MNGGTITLDSVEGEIAFEDKSLTIDASMLTNGLTIDAQLNSRIFNITDTSLGVSPPEVELKGLTLVNGSASGNGGAIRSEGLLTISNSTISGCTATSFGGGVYVKVQNNGTGLQDI